MQQRPPPTPQLACLPGLAPNVNSKLIMNLTNQDAHTVCLDAYYACQVYINWPARDGDRTTATAVKKTDAIAAQRGA